MFYHASSFPRPYSICEKNEFHRSSLCLLSRTLGVCETYTFYCQNLTEGEGIQVVGKDNETYTYYNNSLEYAALIQVDTTLDPKTDDYDDTEKDYFTELQNKDHYSYDDML
ncbi:hypothetical protein XENOCAPTIV_022705 [Xenoophorus captivus]|uniref:Uncharacterized protein n=1 Tax=Xenoophorus captivus TaxID=1517983 RepID=A0ABV0S8B9_9TELE